jgi:hypothetical protein
MYFGSFLLGVDVGTLLIMGALYYVHFRIRPIFTEN